MSSGKNSDKMGVNFSVSLCFYLEFYATKIAKLTENFLPRKELTFKMQYFTKS